jgi:hypothetical protein
MLNATVALQMDRNSLFSARRLPLGHLLHCTQVSKMIQCSWLRWSKRRKRNRVQVDRLPHVTDYPAVYVIHFALHLSSTSHRPSENHQDCHQPHECDCHFCTFVQVSHSNSIAAPAILHVTVSMWIKSSLWILASSPRSRLCAPASRKASAARK